MSSSLDIPSCLLVLQSAVGCSSGGTPRHKHLGYLFSDHIPKNETILQHLYCALRMKQQNLNSNKCQHDHITDIYINNVTIYANVNNFLAIREQTI